MTAFNQPAMTVLNPPDLMAHRILTAIRDSAEEAGPMTAGEERDFYRIAIDEALAELEKQIPVVVS